MTTTPSPAESAESAESIEPLAEALADLRLVADQLQAAAILIASALHVVTAEAQAARAAAKQAQQASRKPARGAKKARAPHRNQKGAQGRPGAS